MSGCVQLLFVAELEPCLGLRQGSWSRPICEESPIGPAHLHTNTGSNAYKWPPCCRSDADRRPSERQALNMTLLHETSGIGGDP